MEVTLSGPKLSKKDIVLFEQTNNILLQNDYRDFMLEHNGGLVTGTKWKNQDQGVVTLTWHETSRCPDKQVYAFGGDLYSLNEIGKNDFENIAYNLESLKENAENFGVSKATPDGAVPVGKDPGGNLFLHMTKGPYTGAILFWNRFYLENITDMDLGYVAPSFSAYIQSLREAPENWDALEAEAVQKCDPR